MNGNVGKELYNCEQCSKLFGDVHFDNKNEFEDHILLHKKVDIMKESTNLCPIEPQKTELQKIEHQKIEPRNIENQTTEPQKFEPQVKNINTPLDLRVHFPHGNLECKTCGKIFLNKEFLILHIRSDHVIATLKRLNLKRLNIKILSLKRLNLK